MPSIPLHVASTTHPNRVENSLPKLLQTPAGLAILEIQGTINLPTALPSSSTTPVGRLVFPGHSVDATEKAWMGKVHLYVGQHQRLTGEVKKLPNPVAVIRKRIEGTDQIEELEIVEIIYYKIIFSNRPEPVGT